jgi:hypothetical protein
MATRPVRFEFNCENTSNKLIYYHNIPSHLITVEWRSSGYVNSFLSAITPIMKAHEADCRRASDPQCGNCGSAAVGILQTPMSLLRDLSEPVVPVFVHSVCEKDRCEVQTRQKIQTIMAEVGQDSPIKSLWEPEEILCCKICGRIEGVRRCGRCKVVAYCGRDHQKMDWKLHKEICVVKEK